MCMSSHVFCGFLVGFLFIFFSVPCVLYCSSRVGQYLQLENNKTVFIMLLLHLLKSASFTCFGLTVQVQQFVD